MKLVTNRLIGLALGGMALFLAACSGGAGMQLAVNQDILPAPEMLSVSGKVVSGAPEGIYLTWTRISDPRVQGYYVYRDTETIPDPGPDGLLPVELRTNGGVMVNQPVAGSTVTFNDLFDIVIGVEYFYRVTTVDSQDPPQESYPSDEVSWLAHGHSVVGLDPLSAYWGDTVTITGDTFGAYDPLTDTVQFVQSGGGAVEGTVDTWSDTEITVIVPDQADVGPVTVLIDGTIAQTDEDLVILNPFVDAIEPQIGFLEQPITITGRNFGETQGISAVYFDLINASANVTSWSDTEITVIVPGTVTGPADVAAVVWAHLSTTKVFTPRAEILNAGPTGAQSGEPLTLSGRFFGDIEGSVVLDGSVVLTVESWQDDAVVVTVAGIPGDHTFTVETDEGVLSNDFPHAIGGELGITMTGVNPKLLYRPGMNPIIGVNTAADADRVELLVDGTPFAESTTAPFGDLVLEVGELINGQHEIQLQVHRRAISALSNIVEIYVYSLIGDVNSDGVVDDLDVDELNLHLGAVGGQPEYMPWYDSDGDGVVTEADLAYIGYNYGDTVL